MWSGIGEEIIGIKTIKFEHLKGVFGENGT
jgi:hypothetical protein